jgi:uncharacterized membrane protein YheB (UPF0754 family)
MNYWLILIPLISAFIGWFTNWIAIKMLFHPKEPKKILGITFHGIFPKRQQQFAEKLGKLVSERKLAVATHINIRRSSVLARAINAFPREKRRYTCDRGTRRRGRQAPRLS